MKVEVIYIRAPATLKEQLRDAAKDNDRTLNKEIVRRLHRSFTAYKQ